MNLSSENNSNHFSVSLSLVEFFIAVFFLCFFNLHFVLWFVFESEMNEKCLVLWSLLFTYLPYSNCVTDCFMWLLLYFFFYEIVFRFGSMFFFFVIGVVLRFLFHQCLWSHFENRNRKKNCFWIRILSFRSFIQMWFNL